MSLQKGGINKVPPQQKHAWFSFLKSIASFKGDLASLTAPPFLLSPQSMTEFSAYWGEHPSIFVAPASEPDPAKRALLVLKWFLSTLKQQHSNIDENGKRKKMKPLNPFLGEIFLGKWEDEAGRTNLVSEQVSHHPPITAFHVWNNEHGVRFQGHIIPKVYFSGTIHVDRKGYSILHIDKYNEDHLINMPKAHVEGLMTGTLVPELSGSTYIRSSSGYTTKINYLSKGWLGGKRNSFTASVFHNDHEDEPIYTAEGQWNGTFTFTEVKTQREVEKLDMCSEPRTPLIVADLENQHPLESRKAWQHVVTAIHEGNIFAVGHEKSKIEVRQREMRKEEKSDGIEWSRRYFSRVNEDFMARNLATSINGGRPLKGDDGEYKGIWMWDEQKYQAIQLNELNGEKSPTRLRFDSGIGGDLLESMGVH